MATNLQTAKQWMLGNEARSSNGNLSTNGQVLFSYATPIGYRMPAKGGHMVPLITAHSYSVTTEGKHKNAASRAANYQAFRVPFFGIGRVGRHGPDTLDRGEAHTNNVAYLKAQYAAEIDRLKRARAYRSFDHLQRLAAEVTRYQTTFSLPTEPVALGEDIKAIEAHWADKARKAVKGLL